MENNKLKIETEFGNIVCEKYDDGVQALLAVYLEDKNGVMLQDIVNVAQKMDWKSETLQNIIDVTVWANENMEDYTNRFEINPLDGEKNDE